ncbi:MAG: sigma-E processing peptidase SpoIIGA [Turicibacter sp.]|nr:sigma-E processing peptidase SpoIIGA [Turicibacter sp.]
MFLDLLFIQDLFFDYLILSAVGMLIGRRATNLRLVPVLLSAFFLSVAFYLFLPPALWLVPLLLIWVAFGPMTRKLYTKSAIYFYGISMFLSGVAHTMLSFVRFDIGIIPYLLSAMGISFILTLAYVIKNRWLMDSQTISQFTYDVQLFCGTTEIKGVGYVDTGNHLVDEATAHPVMMIPKTFLPQHPVADFLDRQQIKRWETTYSVINDDTQSLLVFKPTLLMINGEVVRDVVVGIVENGFVDYDFLLQPAMVRQYG